MLANASEGSPTRQRLSSAERREAIVRAAMDLFSQNGFRGTTTRELASAVGVSEPVLYQHFATKKDLFGAIVDVMLAEVTENFEAQLRELPENASAEVFFEWLGNVILSWYLDNTKYIRILLFSALEGHELKDLWYERATAQFLAFIEGHIQGRLDSGEFRPMHPLMATEAFVGMAAHFGLISGIFQCRIPGLEREAVVKPFVQIYLDGMRASRGTETPQ